MVEIERKFLAAVVRPVPLAFGQTRGLRQSYLHRGPWLEWRVRRTVHVWGEHRPAHRTTIKLGRGHRRGELEVPIPERVYGWLAARGGPPLEKTRVAVAGWEVDLFEGSLLGLCLAEAELPSRTAALPPAPPWLVVGREVTDDPAFSNAALAALSPADAAALATAVQAEWRQTLPFPSPHWS